MSRSFITKYPGKNKEQEVEEGRKKTGQSFKVKVNSASLLQGTLDSMLFLSQMQYADIPMASEPLVIHGQW